MTSSRPYLLRAIYDWLVDNQLTPYIMVDSTFQHVSVPDEYVEDDKIILNVSPQAVAALSLGNVAVEFDAQFSGVTHHIYAPIQAVKAVYAYENGRGMVFSEDDDDGDDDTAPPSDQPPKHKGRPNLKVVK